MFRKVLRINIKKENTYTPRQAVITNPLRMNPATLLISLLARNLPAFDKIRVIYNPT